MSPDIGENADIGVGNNPDVLVPPYINLKALAHGDK
jgi:hypothetical protein